MHAVIVHQDLHQTTRGGICTLYRLGLLASVWDLGMGVCSWQDLRFDL
jgi:hypothetical protein